MSKPSIDDIILWPDGTWCTRGEYERGEYAMMSDDFEAISLGDLARLGEVGLLGELGLVVGSAS